MTPVFGLCDDYVSRWAALDQVAAGMQGVTSAFGAATDYGPDGWAAPAELISATLAALGQMSITTSFPHRCGRARGGQRTPAD